MAAAGHDQAPLRIGVSGEEDHLGTFRIEGGALALSVDAWLHVILDDSGTPVYRRVALADIGTGRRESRRSWSGTSCKRTSCCGNCSTA